MYLEKLRSGETFLKYLYAYNLFSFKAVTVNILKRYFLSYQWYDIKNSGLVKIEGKYAFLLPFNKLLLTLKNGIKIDGISMPVLNVEFIGKFVPVSVENIIIYLHLLKQYTEGYAFYISDEKLKKKIEQLVANGWVYRLSYKNKLYYKPLSYDELKTNVKEWFK